MLTDIDSLELSMCVSRLCLTEEVEAVDVPIEALLPSHTDNSCLLSSRSLLVGKIVLENMPYFKELYLSFAMEHIQRKFSV